MELALETAFFDVDVWQLMAVFIKALTYGASFFTGGGMLFLLLFYGDLTEQEWHTFTKAVAWASLIVIALSIFRIAIMNGLLSGSSAAMFDLEMTRMVLQSREGWATGLRLAGAVLVWVMLRGSATRIKNSIAIFGAILIVISFAWVGHAGEVKGYGVAPMALLLLHLLAIAYWLGALWPLYRLACGKDMPHIARVMRRFGVIAAFMVSLLIVSGLILLSLILGTLDELWRSAYGQMFVIKLSSVALLLGFAAMNKLRLTPRLSNGEGKALAQLKRSIQFEMVLVGIILFATACFTTLVGPTTMQ